MMSDCAIMFFSGWLGDRIFCEMIVRSRLGFWMVGRSC
ncbi:hypothetical protein APA_4903 [Pseudanabaena sp. lw0831]|nr:hypothetical protein APA_4903 [Pseudanabaena sp. lw0831]